MDVRKPPQRPRPQPDERTWSARSSIHPRAAREELVHYSALPAETGPVWAPDRLAIWPLEGGRYGIDAHYFGSTGVTRARRQAERLSDAGLRAGVHVDDEGGLLRLGPLARGAVWVALESFLGKPLEVE
jgi:hypothetical protein